MNSTSHNESSQTVMFSFSKRKLFLNLVTITNLVNELNIVVEYLK